MEKYTEQQKAVFQQFYEQCKKANIDPCGGEASRRKAVLLAADNKALKKILGKNPTEDDVVAAYRAGAEKLRQKENVQRSDEAAQRTAQLRKRDAAYADMERQIAQNHGRDKRIFFLEKKISDLDERMRSARGHALSTAQLSVGLSSSMQQKESSWGTLGGIAAGITGSTAVGAAVAAETMAKNAQIRQENAKIEQQTREMFSPLIGRALDNEAVISALKRKAEAMREPLKLLLVDEPKIEKLMEQVSIHKPQCCFTGGGTMVVRADVSVKGGLKVADSTNAVLDGYFVAEIFDGNQVVSTAYLNIPRDGIASDSTATLYGHALSVPKGGNYTVLISPVDLWVAEEYQFRKLTELNGREKIVETVYDLPELCGYNFENEPWSPLKVSSKTWQQRYKSLQSETKHREKRDRLIYRPTTKQSIKFRNVFLCIAIVCGTVMALLGYLMLGEYGSRAIAVICFTFSVIMFFGFGLGLFFKPTAKFLLQKHQRDF